MLSDRRKKSIKAYGKKMRDPRWLAKRDEILKRDNNKCKNCGRDGESVTLQVHHIEYKRDTEPWDYPDSNFETLCIKCHFEVTIDEELERYVRYSGGLGSLSKKHRKFIREAIISELKKGERFT